MGSHTMMAPGPVEHNHIVHGLFVDGGLVHVPTRSKALKSKNGKL